MPLDTDLPADVPKNTPEVMAQYCNLMEEIKVRINTVRSAAAGQLPVHPRVAYELSYLQLRMVCELIALACVVAHGDLRVAQSGKMKNEDRGAVMLKMLNEVHPDFYPQPTRQILNSKGAVEKVDDIKSGFLTKEELLQLYGICGNELHKGKVRKIGFPLTQAISFKEVGSWCEKIMTLLSHHRISLYNSTSQVWVLMHAATDGKVHWAFMKLLSPA